ncbi:MAG: hypothetical protein ACQESC_02535 [Nanobdellota archaeon]
MKEKTLTLIALITGCIGFIILSSIVILQKPAVLTFEKTIPEDTTVSFKGIVTKADQTESGTLLTIKRTVKITGFIDSSVPKQFIGQQANITAKKSDDFLSIEQLDVLN